MSEPTQQSNEPSPEAAELATLGQAHREVLTKRQKDKACIAELESTVVALQGKLAESADAIHELAIDGRLRSMAESMSTVPDLFLEQFGKHFKLEMVKGSLTLLNATDGKPVINKDGKAVPFQRDTLTKFLTDGDDARAKTSRSNRF